MFSPHLLPDKSTRLCGRGLLLARAAWILVAALALGVFVAGVPVAFGRALAMTTEGRIALAQIGLSDRFPAVVLTFMSIVTMAAFASTSGAIFAVRSDDWLALYVSLMLLLMGLIFSGPAVNAPLPVWLVAGLIGLGETLQLFFLFLFPNGRWVPRWIRFLILPALLWRLSIWGLRNLPLYHTLLASGSPYGAFPLSPYDVALTNLVYLVGVVAQMYRYRCLSTRVQRQQAKWLLWGIGVSISVVGPILLFVDGLHLLRRFGPYELLGVTLAHSLGQVVILAVPAAIAVATLKYQLFEVDRLINRTLVYTMLTAALVLVYFSSVVLLQQVVGAVAPSGLGGVPVVSTLAIAALFQPLRRRVQVTIDRRFYRHKYDAIRTLQTLNTTLRSEVDLQTLRLHLLDVVDETMRPAHLSLWLRDDALDRRQS